MIAAPSTRILAVGTLLSMIALCWSVPGVVAKPAGPRAESTTLGYNRAHGFFYGTAKMPAKTDASGGFACLTGNCHFRDGPRLLRDLPRPARARPLVRDPVAAASAL